jgi:hypothetical protein
MKERRLEDGDKSYKKEEIIDLDLVDNIEQGINLEKIECEFELGDGPDIGISESSTEQEDSIQFELGDSPDTSIIEGSTEQEDIMKFQLDDGSDVGIIEGCIEQEDIIEFELGKGPDIGNIKGSIEPEDTIEFELDDGPGIGFIEDNYMETQEHEKGIINRNMGYKQVSDRILNNEQRIGIIVSFIIIMISTTLELKRNILNNSKTHQMRD